MASPFAATDAGAERLVRLGTLLAAVALAIFALLALATWDPFFVKHGLTAAAIALSGVILLAVKRPSVAVFIVVAMVVMAVDGRAAATSPPTGAMVGLVVLGMLGTAVVRSRTTYMVLVGSALVAIAFYWKWGSPAQDIVELTVGPVLAFVLGGIMLTGLSRTREAFMDRYYSLFAHTPVSLWEEDYSQVAAWLEELRAAGITDLESHLDDHPGLLMHAAGLITVRDVNEETLRFMGASSRSALLGPLSLPASPGGLAALRDQLLALWDGDDRVESEFLTRTKNGTEVDVVLHWAVPRRHGRLDPANVIVSVADVTAQNNVARELQRARDRFERLARNAPDVVSQLRLRPNLQFEYLSPAVTTLTGHQPEEFYADPGLLARMVHPEDRRTLRRALRGASGGPTLTFRLIHKNGRVVWVDHRLVPICDLDGRLAILEGISRDATDRVLKERRLADLVRAKDEFVASVSHELRTPLTGVVGLAAELRDRHDDIGTTEFEDLSSLLVQQSQEVADLVDDLLVAARADTGSIAVAAEPTDLRTQVDSVLEELAQAPQEVTVDGDGVLAMADPKRVRQVVRNLLTNAFRYGGDTVEVRIANGTRLARLEVADDGGGIGGIDPADIFTPYVHGAQPSSQPGAVGLGLSVSRQLAELMRGELSFSRQDDWTVFRLTLPAP